MRRPARVKKLQPKDEIFEFPPEGVAVEGLFERVKKGKVYDLHLTMTEDKKTIIVTGASRGLGKCIVQNILDDYARAQVVLIARNGDQLQAFYDGLSTEDRQRVLIAPADVTDRGAVVAVLEQTLARFGQIDGVVCNAGVLEPVGHLDEADYDMAGMRRLFEVNFFSVVQLVNETLTRTGRGTVNLVFVSSGASTRGIDGWLAYGASKAALNALCKQLHDEMYPRVRSMSVAPGVVDTDMQRAIREQLRPQMSAESHRRFVELHSGGELLDGMVVGKVYARLAVDGPPATAAGQAVCGEYVRWNDPRLSVATSK